MSKSRANGTMLMIAGLEEAACGLVVAHERVSHDDDRVK